MLTIRGSFKFIIIIEVLICPMALSSHLFPGSDVGPEGATTRLIVDVMNVLCLSRLLNTLTSWVSRFELTAMIIPVPDSLPTLC